MGLMTGYLYKDVWCCPGNKKANMNYYGNPLKPSLPPTRSDVAYTNEKC